MPDIDNALILRLLDLAGIGVFALSGALMAVRLRQTLVTAAFFALVTGVGGGSVRDLLIGAPVFWVQDGAISAVCIAIALIVWLTPERWWQGQLLEWADAVGLAAYAVFGTAKAIAWGVPPAPALLMGVITGCVGGTIRDTLAGVPSIMRGMLEACGGRGARVGAVSAVAVARHRHPGGCGHRSGGWVHPARRGDPLVAGAARLSRSQSERLGARLDVRVNCFMVTEIGQGISVS